MLLHRLFGYCLYDGLSNNDAIRQNENIADLWQLVMMKCQVSDDVWRISQQDASRSAQFSFLKAFA